jgi:hypothetical protein
MNEALFLERCKLRMQDNSLIGNGVLQELINSEWYHNSVTEKLNDEATMDNEKLLEQMRKATLRRFWHLWDATVSEKGKPTALINQHFMKHLQAQWRIIYREYKYESLAKSVIPTDHEIKYFAAALLKLPEMTYKWIEADIFNTPAKPPYHVVRRAFKKLAIEVVYDMLPEIDDDTYLEFLGLSWVTFLALKRAGYNLVKDFSLKQPLEKVPGIGIARIAEVTQQCEGKGFDFIATQAR